MACVCGFAPHKQDIAVGESNGAGAWLRAGVASAATRPRRVTDSLIARSMMNILFDVENLLRTYSYVGVFVIVFLESGIFFALPGDSLLFTAGLFASVAGLNLFILIPSIFVATFLGGLVGYELGIYIESLHRYRFFRAILKPEYIAKAHQFFDAHGKGAILLSRFVPLMRTFAPIAAGIGRMHRPSFVKYSFFSSLLWSVSVTLLGFFLGEIFPQITGYLHYFVFGIIFVSLIPFLTGWLSRRVSRRRTSGSDRSA